VKEKVLKYVQMACQGDCDDCMDCKPDPCVHSANQIMATLIEELKVAIRGKYPDGNSYADQMQRVQNLMEQLRAMK